MKNILFLTIVISVITFACKKEVETFEKSGINYAAEKVGRIRIYRVDSNYFSINDKFNSDIDTVISYLQKHETITIFTDSTNKDYFYHLVSILDSTKHWIPQYAYKTQVDSFNFEKIENNERVLALSFPVYVNKSWDGNLYNPNKGIRKFKYIIEDEMLLQDSIYANQIIVRQQKDIYPVTESYAYFEAYAPNIGMIYSLSFYSDKQLDNGIYIESGFKVHKNLISYE